MGILDGILRIFRRPPKPRKLSIDKGAFPKKLKTKLSENKPALKPRPNIKKEKIKIFKHTEKKPAIPHEEPSEFLKELRAGRECNKPNVYAGDHAMCSVGSTPGVPRLAHILHDRGYKFSDEKITSLFQSLAKISNEEITQERIKKVLAHHHFSAKEEVLDKLAQIIHSLIYSKSHVPSMRQSPRM